MICEKERMLGYVSQRISRLWVKSDQNKVILFFSRIWHIPCESFTKNGD